MTKLLEWLGAATVFFGVWFAVVFGRVRSPFLDEWARFVAFSPVVFAGLFGLYATSVVAYRVLAFDDCEYAARELQEQIVEARGDLKKRGFTF